MSRRKAAPKRVILPDPLFRSELVSKFVNTVMRNGEKSIAEKIVYNALDYVVKKNPAAGKAGEESSEEGGSSSKKAKAAGDIWNNETVRKSALDVFKQVIDNIMPTVEVKSRRVGGSTYQVPIEIRAERRMALAMRWLAEYAKKRNEKSMAVRLGNEILDALSNRGGAMKKREDVHRMAKANQAFAHYRW
jgi:small subunit ribosomal protein S7